MQHTAGPGICGICWRDSSILVASGNQPDLPVLAFGMSTQAQVLGLRRVRSHLANNGTLDVAFSLTQQDRHTEVVPLFNWKTGSSMAGLCCPSHGRSRQSGYPVRPSAEGRSSWLNFPRKILSFSIPNWFLSRHTVSPVTPVQCRFSVLSLFS